MHCCASKSILLRQALPALNRGARRGRSYNEVLLEAQGLAARPGPAAHRPGRSRLPSDVSTLFGPGLPCLGERLPYGQAKPVAVRSPLILIHPRQNYFRLRQHVDGA